MSYRGVVNGSNVLIAFGNDESQSGAYHDMGTWCDFTFESFPESEVTGDNVMLYKVVDEEVAIRTQEEVDA